MYQSTVCPFARSSTAAKSAGAPPPEPASVELCDSCEPSEPQADRASAPSTRAAAKAVERGVMCTPVNGLVADRSRT